MPATGAASEGCLPNRAQVARGPPRVPDTRPVLRVADEPNRLIYVDRWTDCAPRDDVELWAACGLEVTDHKVVHVAAEDRRLCQPSPVLRRRVPVTVTEHPPVLRWALKSPAPAGPTRESWGDTHFARRLAVALRDLGQDVVIDTREAFYRSSAHTDDVVLALRGLTAFRPSFEHVSLGWIISHPEMLSRTEASSYDRIFAASELWASRIWAEWGIRVDPLLQATDPGLFHPDRARPDTGHPLLFVGGARKQYRPMVRHAVEANLPLAVYGTEWEPFIPQRFIRGAYLANDELGAAYRAAGIVLNDHWEDMRREGFLSNRLFDAVASGGRVVTDAVAGLGGLFGRSVHVVESADELCDLASRHDLDVVFGDDAERSQVAERVRKEHSFAARASRLLEAALEIRHERLDRGTR